MTLPNHIAGGLVFTGVFGGIAGINILESPGLMIMTVAGATIADMDLPQSLWGRILGPLSRAVNRKFGHRTITHSLLFMGALGLLIRTVCLTLEVEAPYPTVFFLSFFSHLLFDMMTVQGVPIFYPYRKNPCVIPADPVMRFNSNNRKSEFALFCFFILSGVFMQPLMSDGFWTTYNRMFGTIQHLQSEYEKSEDLLLAKYRYREASNEYEDSGYVIEASGDVAVLWDERDGWTYLDGTSKSLKTILDIIPEHTGKKFQINRKSFVAVSRDSLQSILSNALIYRIELSANHPFAADYGARTGIEQRVTNNLQLEMVDHLQVRELPAVQETTAPRRTVTYQASPRIRTLQAKKAKLQRRQAQELSSYKEHQQQLQAKARQLEQELDIYQQTKLQQELAKLEKEVVLQPDYDDELAELDIQIAELQRNDQLKYEEKVVEMEVEVAAARAVQVKSTGPLQLTGMITVVEFEQEPEEGALTLNQK